jgi:hypothetical protein
MRPGDHWFVKLPRDIAFAGAPDDAHLPEGEVVLEIAIEGVKRAGP